jgi:hypothetical protein
MKHILLLLFATSLILTACSLGFLKQDVPIINKTGCTLPAGQRLVIGCTVECGNNYVDALELIADNMEYDIEVISIQENPGITVDGIISPGGGGPFPARRGNSG